ncbi:MAG: hypothetical protein FRX49_03043 [Trebouxia sp. A1-2]|nr:MAG: hypothetical protein FRX49_03043 [Trebouxia sp. A1-2]
MLRGILHRKGRIPKLLLQGDTPDAPLQAPILNRQASVTAVLALRWPEPNLQQPSKRRVCQRVATTTRDSLQA